MTTNWVASSAQCRAARALLGWTQQDLAEHAGVARKTVADFEAGLRRLQVRTRADITRTLEIAGIEFTWRGHIEGIGIAARESAFASMAKAANGAGNGVAAAAVSDLEASQS
jgi:transcriptional regulator with XRE-family HTH domain